MKKTNKLWLALLLTVLVAALLAVGSTAAAEEPAVIDQGYCGGEGDGTNLTWVLDSEGTLTISGEGAMMEGNGNMDYPWFQYQTQIQQLILDERMSSIGQFSCVGFKMTELIIPNNIKQIGMSAFSGFNQLKRVDLPEELPNIVYGMFNGCEKLTDITIPDTVQTIGAYAFENCKALTRVNLPETMTEINDYTFYGCTSLSDVTIPKHVTRIGNNAFCACNSITSVQIPAGVTSIGESAFEGCSFSTITVPGSVQSMGDSAFCSNSSLRSAVLAPGITKTSEYMFSGSTEIIVIPKSVVEIDYPIIDPYQMGYVTHHIYYAGSEEEWHQIQFGSLRDDGPYWVPLEQYAVMHYNYEFQTVDATPSTCTEPGYTEGLFCDVTNTWVSGHEELPLADHTPGEAVIENNVPATCTEAGGYDEVVYCTQCPAEISRTHVTVDPINHSHAQNVAATEATETAHGFTAGVWCPDCETWVSGHEVVHNAFGAQTVIKPATEEEEGLVDIVCTVCGETVRYTAEKLPHTEPQPSGTGDSGNGFWMRIQSFFRGIIDWFLRLFKWLG